MKLIGLTGPKGSGKSTVAKILNAYGFKTLAFADPIKQSLSALFGLTSACLDGSLKETPLNDFGGVTPRYLMQTLGTEWGRNLVDKDIWVQMAKQRLKFAKDARIEPIVFTDVRFDNEADWIRSEGGVIWHIFRRTNGPQDIHESEAGLAVNLTRDVVINNNDSLEELEETVAELLG